MIQTITSTYHCTGYFSGCDCASCRSNTEWIVTYRLDEAPYERLDHGDKRWIPVETFTITRLLKHYEIDIGTALKKMDQGEMVDVIFCQFRRRKEVPV